MVVPEFYRGRPPRKYRQEQDPLRDFLDGEVAFAPWHYVPVAELRARYEQWAKENDLRYTLSPREFNRRLGARDCLRKPTKVYNELGTETVVKCWHGLTLSSSPRSRPHEEMHNEIPM